MAGIRVFISHSSKDQDFARLLINLLRSALDLPAAQIRCTSVDGYRLPGGASAAEHLRREIYDTQAFIGVISAHSFQSLYVMFELGARWGAQKHLIPLLAPGVSHSILGAPLSDLNALQAGEAAQLHQLVHDLAEVLAVAVSKPAAYQREIEAIQQLNVPGNDSVRAGGDAPVSDDAQSTRPTVALSSEARQILLEAINDPDPSILCVRTMSGTHVQVNQVDFTEGANARTQKRWVAAVRELESLGMIEDLSHKGEVFEPTVVGWDIAEKLQTDGNDTAT